MRYHRTYYHELQTGFYPGLPSLGKEEPSTENPKPGSVNSVVVEVNAVKEKKSDKEILAVRLRNLEKAGAMKALYKVRRGEESLRPSTG